MHAFINVRSEAQPYLDVGNWFARTRPIIEFEGGLQRPKISPRCPHLGKLHEDGSNSAGRLSQTPPERVQSGFARIWAMPILQWLAAPRPCISGGLRHLPSLVGVRLLEVDQSSDK